MNSKKYLHIKSKKFSIYFKIKSTDAFEINYILNIFLYVDNQNQNIEIDLTEINEIRLEKQWIHKNQQKYSSKLLYSNFNKYKKIDEYIRD